VAIRKVEKRLLPSGKVTFRAPYVDAAGNRRSQNFSTAKAAKTFLVAVGGELRQGVHTPSSESPTVSEAAELWLASCARRQLEPTTVINYKEHLRLHILPLIGNTKLSELTPTAIHGFVDRLHEGGRSPDMCRRVVRSLGAIFVEARRRGLSAAAPTEGIGKKKANRDNPRPVIPSKLELRTIIECARARGPRWHALVLVAIFCGLRASELRGLCWANVDLHAGLLHVVQRADAQGHIGKLKSRAGYRTVPLPELVTQALREWKLQCPHGAPGLVFPNTLGKVDYYPSIIKFGFAPILRAAGLEGRFGLHALRHAAASLWIEQALSPKRIQVLMGHSSIKMTFDTYGHLFLDTESDARVASRMQASLLGS
jgi:integrase